MGQATALTAREPPLAAGMSAQPTTSQGGSIPWQAATGAQPTSQAAVRPCAPTARLPSRPTPTAAPRRLPSPRLLSEPARATAEPACVTGPRAERPMPPGREGNTVQAPARVGTGGGAEPGALRGVQCNYCGRSARRCQLQARQGCICRVGRRQPWRELSQGYISGKQKARWAQHSPLHLCLRTELAQVCLTAGVGPQRCHAGGVQRRRARFTHHTTGVHHGLTPRAPTPAPRSCPQVRRRSRRQQSQQRPTHI